MSLADGVGSFSGENGFEICRLSGVAASPELIDDTSEGPSKLLSGPDPSEAGALDWEPIRAATAATVVTGPDTGPDITGVDNFWVVLVVSLITVARIGLCGGLEVLKPENLCGACSDEDLFT